MASTRPSNDGKGGKELNKGKGLPTKGGQKGVSSAKGSGKEGIQGILLPVRHRANECRTHSANAVEEEDEEEWPCPLEEGAWMVGAVDEYEDENRLATAST